MSGTPPFSCALRVPIFKEMGILLADPALERSTFEPPHPRKDGAKARRRTILAAPEFRLAQDRR